MCLCVYRNLLYRWSSVWNFGYLYYHLVPFTQQCKQLCRDRTGYKYNSCLCIVPSYALPCVCLCIYRFMYGILYLWCSGDIEYCLVPGFYQCSQLCGYGADK
jgi:hypothetical protein